MRKVEFVIDNIKTYSTDQIPTVSYLYVQIYTNMYKYTEICINKPMTRESNIKTIRIPKTKPTGNTYISTYAYMEI